MDSPEDLNLTLDEIATLLNERQENPRRQQLYQNAMSAWAEAHAPGVTVEHWERLAAANQLLVRALRDDQAWLDQALERARTSGQRRLDLDRARERIARLLKTAQDTERMARGLADP